METIKINQLEIENVKRVKAVAITPTENGMTIIGGNNNQGKTSILDAIAWALGGERYRPSSPMREGSVLPPHIKMTLNNGLVVERAGKNSSLKVLDPEGRKSGQQLLNEFVETLALDLPKFMAQNNQEKANTLLRIIGVENEVHALEREETDLYNRRRVVGQEATRKQKFAEEMPFYPDAPKEPVSTLELIRQQQDILARNGENQRKRDRLKEITFEKHRIFDEISRLEAQANDLQARIQERKNSYEQVSHEEELATKDASELHDESTAELERSLENIETINVKVRSNLDKEKAEMDAQQYQKQYNELTAELDYVRQKKIELLNGANLPLPGLSVEDGELSYQGKKWDAMSGSDQLRVSAAIVRAINPKCGFVLMDKLEQMDINTLAEFGRWLEQEGLQVIATRVSTGGECSIIIEDGYAISQEHTEPAPAPVTAPKWKKGVF